MTYSELSQKYNINYTRKRVYDRPDGIMNDMPRHFHFRISRGTHSFGLYFSQGSGHTQDPTLEDVLDCLASDASGYDNAGSFENWASEYGYDTDSRKAEKTYRTIKRQVEQLKRTLGDTAYDELLYNTERL